MKPVVEVTILDKKSNLLQVRGIATVDGIEIPFTVYRARIVSSFTPEGHLQCTAVVRTKSGIIKEFGEADYIRNKLRDKARGWWIDKGIYGDYEWSTRSVKS